MASNVNRQKINVKGKVVESRLISMKAPWRISVFRAEGWGLEKTE
jgi:hypothetical protein